MDDAAIVEAMARAICAVAGQEPDKHVRSEWTWRWSFVQDGELVDRDDSRDMGPAWQLHVNSAEAALTAYRNCERADALSRLQRLGQAFDGYTVTEKQA